jgi:hypothetical protein
LRSRASGSAPSLRWCAFTLAAALLAGCGSDPLSPDRPPVTGFGSLLGTWEGTIDTVIGRGTLTVVLGSPIGSGVSTQYIGSWRTSFADPIFSTEGTVSTGFDRTGTILLLLFSRATVPCPGQPNGVGFTTRAANFLLPNVSADGRMRGSYVAADCPVGTMELAKK